MDEITVCYCMPLGSQIRNSIHHVGRVPRHYRIGYQVETAGLIGLIFGLMPPNVSLIGEKEKLPESMQCLPLVKLGMNAPPIIGVFQIAQDEEGLHQAAIFLQSAREGVLTRIRLHATDEQGRGNPAPFERPCHPKQIIPGIRDQLLIDHPFEQGLDMLIRLRPIHAIEPLLPQVENTWRKLQPKQIEEGKEHFGIYVDTLPRYLHKTGYVSTHS